METLGNCIHKDKETGTCEFKDHSVLVEADDWTNTCIQAFNTVVTCVEYFNPSDEDVKFGLDNRAKT